MKILNLTTGQEITPLASVTYRSHVGTNYVVSCFSTRWDLRLFEEFPDTDACLVIHEPEEFGERMHMAAEVQLAGWVGMDGPVAYGFRSQLGAVFSKPLHFIDQHEWRFAWVPSERLSLLQPKLLTIGNLERIAELRTRGAASPTTAADLQ